jgi:hypothetical protein
MVMNFESVLRYIGHTTMLKIGYAVFSLMDILYCECCLHLLKS